MGEVSSSEHHVSEDLRSTSNLEKEPKPWPKWVGRLTPRSSKTLGRCQQNVLLKNRPANTLYSPQKRHLPILSIPLHLDPGFDLDRIRVLHQLHGGLVEISSA